MNLLAINRFVDPMKMQVRFDNQSNLISPFHFHFQVKSFQIPDELNEIPFIWRN